MMVFDHVDLRVSDVERCRGFYDAFLRAFGFRGQAQPDGVRLYYRLQDRAVREAIALIPEPDHRPTRRASRSARRLRPTSIESPRSPSRPAPARTKHPPSCPRSATRTTPPFFEDPAGNRLEVVCR